MALKPLPIVEHGYAFAPGDSAECEIFVVTGRRSDLGDCGT